MQAQRVTLWQAVMSGEADQAAKLLALHETALPVAAPLRRRRASVRDGAALALFSAKKGKYRVVCAIQHRAQPIGWLIAERLGADVAAFSAAERANLAQFAEQIGPALNLALGFNEVLHSREQLVLAREEERRVLRRELHNAIGPSLAALDLRIGTLAILTRQLTEQVGKAANENTAGLTIDAAANTLSAQTGETRQQLRKIIADLRRIIYDLRPALLDELGLVAAIQEQVMQFSQGGLSVTLHTPNAVLFLPAAVEVAAYKIIIEALSNVARHAEATQAEVSIRIAPSGVHLDIMDNGKGIAPDQRHGVGLGSMHEVAAQLGGQVSAAPRPAGGTQVQAFIPCKIAV